jgi:hypothetical protein
MHATKGIFSYLFLKHFLDGEQSEKRATLEPQYSDDVHEFIDTQCSYREKAFKAEFIIVLSVYTSDSCNATEQKCKEDVKNEELSKNSIPVCGSLNLTREVFSTSFGSFRHGYRMEI